MKTMPPPPPPQEWEDMEEMPELPPALPWAKAQDGGEEDVVPSILPPSYPASEDERVLPLPPVGEEPSTSPTEELEESVQPLSSQENVLPSQDEDMFPPLPPPVSEAEGAPVVPPPPPVTEVEGTPVLPPPPPDSSAKKGTGIAVTLGIAAFFAAALGFQTQGNIARIKKENSEILSQVQKEKEQQKKYTDELTDIETTEGKINDADARLKQQEQEYNALKTEIAELQRYSRPYVLAQEKAEEESRISVLQQQSADLDSVLDMYLPPSELSEAKLQQRDAYSRKFALLYYQATLTQAWNILGALYADYVRHQLTGTRSVHVRQVIQKLSNSNSALLGELCVIGYSGPYMELIFKDFDAQKKGWRKEILTLNEQGRVFRSKEEKGTGELPALSDGFRSVTLTPSAK